MVIGQLGGGALVSIDIAGTGWRSIFLVNVPIGLLGVLLAQRTLPETRATDPVRVDRWGTPLLGLALLALLVPLLEGPSLGWPTWCWPVLALFPVLAAGFWLAELRLDRRGRIALLPPSVLRVPSMRRGLVIAVPFFASFGGFMFVYALMLQDGLHFGPLRSGLALTPLAVGFFLTTLAASWTVARLGHRVAVLGALIEVVGLLMVIGAVLLAGPQLGVLQLAPGTFVLGLGQGLAAPTLFRVVLSRVPPDMAGVGSGILTTTQQASLALGVATLGSLFTALGAVPAIGAQPAVVVATLVQVLLLLAVAVLAIRLPDPRLVSSCQGAVERRCWQLWGSAAAMVSGHIGSPWVRTRWSQPIAAQLLFCPVSPRRFR